MNQEIPISFESIKEMSIAKLNEIERDLGGNQEWVIVQDFCFQ